MNWITQRLDFYDRLRRNGFLYFHAIFMTPMLLLSVVPIPNTPYANGLEGIYVFSCFVSTIVALFVLCKEYTRILKYSGGLVRPKLKWKRTVVGALIVLFFVWINNFANILAQLLSPNMLNSSIYPTGLGFSLFTFLTAGPMEETWRWAFIIAAYYFGTRVFPKAGKKVVFWTCVSASVVVFGLGHIGEFSGYTLQTIVVIGASGLLFFFVAYWSRSFWIAVATHSVYDLICSFGWFEYWFVAMAIPWMILAIVYVRWRKRRLSYGTLQSTVTSQGA